MKIDKRMTRHQGRRDEIVRLFRELGSTRLVADRLGVNLSAVANALHKEGIPTPREGRIDPNSACERNAETVLKMSAEGCSLSEIGRTVGTKKEMVKKFLERNGVVKTYNSGDANSGERHYAWKGRLIDKDGYVLIHCKGHPNARKHAPYIFEHRLVMEEFLGRPLLPTEVVHHLDGKKDRNHIENLQLFQSNGEHLAVDLKGRCPKWSPEGFERIRKGMTQRWNLWRESNRKMSEVDAPPCI